MAKSFPSISLKLSAILYLHFSSENLNSLNGTMKLERNTGYFINSWSLTLGRKTPNSSGQEKKGGREVVTLMTGTG